MSQVHNLGMTTPHEPSRDFHQKCQFIAENWGDVSKISQITNDLQDVCTYFYQVEDSSASYYNDPHIEILSQVLDRAMYPLVKDSGNQFFSGNFDNTLKEREAGLKELFNNGSTGENKIIKNMFEFAQQPSCDLSTTSKTSVLIPAAQLLSYSMQDFLTPGGDPLTEYHNLFYSSYGQTLLCFLEWWGQGDSGASVKGETKLVWDVYNAIPLGETPTETEAKKFMQALKTLMTHQ